MTSISTQNSEFILHAIKTVKEGLQAVNQNSYFKLQQVLNETFCVGFNFESFYNSAKELCELESLSFLNEQNVERLIAVRTHVFEKVRGSESQQLLFRQFVGIFVSQMDWQKEVQYSELSSETKKNILGESPCRSWGSLV